MYRILIVDDEPYVVDWVSVLLETQLETELDICRAYTATEALEWLIRFRIDIVISDISMPKMDGLKLAEQVKKRWPFAKVILVTAYAQFDYAVTAIRNNVAGYILKTQGDDVILKEVKRVIALVEMERRQTVFQNQMTDIQWVLPDLQSRFFRELLEQGEEDANRIGHQLEALHISMDVDTPVWLLLCTVREWETVEDLVLRQQSVMKLVELMKSYVGDCGSLYPVDLGGSRMAWLLQEDTMEQQRNTLIQGRLEMLQDACEAGGGEHISFILYAQTVCMLSVRGAYRSLELLMNRMDREKEAFVIFGGEEFGKWKVDTEVISKRMGQLLEEERQEEFTKALSYYQSLAAEDHLGAGDCYSIYYAIALLIHFYMEKREIMLTAQISALKENLFFPPIDGKWEKKFGDLFLLAELIFSTESEMKSSISQNTVEAIMKYIAKHIAEDISLTRLSEVTGYNTCYLSRVFKSQTGVNLSEYIGRKKMECIQALMQDTDLNIGDIADRCGFVSRTYFNRFVRKHTGMSPKDYKMSLKN